MDLREDVCVFNVPPAASTPLPLRIPGFVGIYTPVLAHPSIDLFTQTNREPMQRRTFLAILRCPPRPQSSKLFNPSPSPHFSYPARSISSQASQAYPFTSKFL